MGLERRSGRASCAPTHSPDTVTAAESPSVAQLAVVGLGVALPVALAVVVPRHLAGSTNAAPTSSRAAVAKRKESVSADLRRRALLTRCSALWQQRSSCPAQAEPGRTSNGEGRLFKHQKHGDLQRGRGATLCLV